MIGEDDAKETPLGEPIDGAKRAPIEVHDDAVIAQEVAPDAARLNLAEEERLPWLDSDDDGVPPVDTGRIVGFAGLSLIALAAIVGGIWWVSHRHSEAQLAAADGSTIAAPATPYKEAPKSPGGKTFDGTGDTSFAVSQGQTRQAKLGQGETAPPAGHSAAAKPGVELAPKPSASAVAVVRPAGAEAVASGVGVQVGAFSTQAGAEAAWGRLSARYEALGKLHHRVVEGKADIGTVYRLQAVSPDSGAANALCSGLKAVGLACQVKG